MSRVESSARTEENDTHKSQWILSSADLFLLSRKNCCDGTWRTNFCDRMSRNNSLSLAKIMCLVAHEGERNKCLLDKTDQKKSFIFPGLQKDFFFCRKKIKDHCFHWFRSTLSYNFWARICHERSKLGLIILWMGLYPSQVPDFFQIFLCTFCSFSYFWFKGRTGAAWSEWHCFVQH